MAGALEEFWRWVGCGVVLGGANYNQIKQSLCQYKDSVVQLVIVVGSKKRSLA